MKYMVCTALGISGESYSNMQEWVLGTLQRSGESPCLWLDITYILLGAIAKRHSPGMSLSNPRGTKTQTHTTESYIGGTELILSMENTRLTNIVAEIQEIAQFWEQLLFTTGGAVALEKCFFVAMDRN